MKMAKLKLRCGSRLYDKKEVPANAVVQEWEGRLCYLSGIDGNEAIVRYLDDGSLVRVALVKWNEINKKL